MSDVPRRFALIAAAGVAAVSWLTFLAEPVAYYERLGRTEVGPFWTTVGELTKIQGAVFPNTPLLGPIFLITTGALAMIALTFVGRGVKHFTRPRGWTTALASRFTLYFHGPTLARATMYREQLVIANKPNVTSYQTQHRADQGRISPDVLVESSVAGELITAVVDPSSHGPRDLSVYEDYRRPMPQSWIASYTPAWLVLFLYAHKVLFVDKVVRRIMTVDLHDEYGGESARVQISGGDDAQSVVLEVDFPADIAPRRDALRGVHIRGNYHRRLAPELVIKPGRWIYRVELPKFAGESIRIQWRNREATPLETDETNS